MSESELLPCPLCGGEASIARPGCKGSLTAAGCWGPGHIAYATGSTREEATAVWNQRPADTAERLANRMGATFVQRAIP